VGDERGAKCCLGAGCVNGARPDLRGGELNCARIKYCDTTRGNRWQTGKTNRILNTREFALLTRAAARQVASAASAPALPWARSVVHDRDEVKSSRTSSQIPRCAQNDKHAACWCAQRPPAADRGRNRGADVFVLGRDPLVRHVSRSDDDCGCLQPRAAPARGRNLPSLLYTSRYSVSALISVRNW